VYAATASVAATRGERQSGRKGGQRKLERDGRIAEIC